MTPVGTRPSRSEIWRVPRVVAFSRRAKRRAAIYNVCGKKILASSRISPVPDASISVRHCHEGFAAAPTREALTHEPSAFN